MEKVIVFGSFVVDLMARADRLPKAGETVRGNFFKMGPGGKGFNQAVACHLSLIHISEPTRQCCTSRMPSSA